MTPATLVLFRAFLSHPPPPKNSLAPSFSLDPRESEGMIKVIYPVLRPSLNVCVPCVLRWLVGCRRGCLDAWQQTKRTTFVVVRGPKPPVNLTESPPAYVVPLKTVTK